MVGSPGVHCGAINGYRHSRRKNHNRSECPDITSLNWFALSLPMQRYLLVIMLSTFARASETFILLLRYQSGVSVVELLLLWSVFNFAKAITATSGGRLADCFGRGTLILIGWIAFACSFLLFSSVNVSNSNGLWFASIFYGLFAGLSEGAERALISDYAEADEQGTAFGWYHMV